MNSTLEILWICAAFGLGTGIACIAMCLPFVPLVYAFWWWTKSNAKNTGGANGKC